MPIQPSNSPAEIAELRAQLKLGRRNEPTIVETPARNSEDEEYQRDLQRWEGEGGSVRRFPARNSEDEEYQRDLQRWEGEGGSVLRLAQSVEEVLDRNVAPVRPVPIPTRPEDTDVVDRVTIQGIDWSKSARPPRYDQKDIIFYEPGASLKEKIKDLITSVRGYDWEKIQKELGNSFNSLIISVVAIGDKELINIPLPNLEALRKQLEEFLKNLPKDQSEKIKKQIENLLEKLRAKIKDKADGGEITPEEWLRREREKNNNYENAISNAAEGFTAPRGETLTRSNLKQSINELNQILENNNDPETKKRLARVISTLGLLLATLPILTGSSAKGGEVGSNTTYSDRQKPSADVIEEGKTPTGTASLRQTPDQGVENRVNILQGIKIQGKEDAFNLFGVELGSILGKRGPGIVSIENKTNDQSVSKIMSEKNRRVVWVAVTEVEGKRIMLNLESGSDTKDGVPVLDLNKLSDTELYAIANGVVTWNNVEIKNGVDISPANQNGAFSIREDARRIISERTMNRVLEDQKNKDRRI